MTVFVARQEPADEAPCPSVLSLGCLAESRRGREEERKRGRGGEGERGRGGEGEGEGEREREREREREEGRGKREEGRGKREEGRGGGGGRREEYQQEWIPHKSGMSCLFCNRFARPEHSQDMQFTRRAAYSRTTGAAIGANSVARMLRDAEGSHARKSCAIYLNQPIKYVIVLYIILEGR